MIAKEKVVEKAEEEKLDYEYEMSDELKKLLVSPLTFEHDASG